MNERRVFWTNLEHDLALQIDSENYLPPKTAREIDRDYGILPLWYAPENSVVISGTILTPLQEQILGKKNINISPSTEEDYLYKKNDIHCPWGWDKSILKRIKKKCDGDCPKIDAKAIAELSHRKYAIKLLESMADEDLFDEAMLPIEAVDLARIEKLTQSQKMLLKAPISGSGRGLWWALNGFDFNVRRWSKSTLEKQGSIIVEPIWNKTEDYAIEFCVKDRKVIQTGFSHFKTDGAGVYRCNFLESDDDIKAQLAHAIGIEKLEKIVGLQMRYVEAVFAPHYNGWLGIDMMLGTTRNGKTELNPSVEINLRMTMGTVARLIYDRWVCQGQKGTFATLHCKEEGELKKISEEKSHNNPLAWEKDRIKKGYLLLTNQNKNAHFGIEVEIK